jgi:hypothetical protein
MPEPSNAEIARREAWAARENQRRQDVYDRADLAWSRDAQLFDWMLTTARSDAGFAPSHGSGFVPKRGETLLGEFGGCKLIEAKRGPGAYQGGTSGFSFEITRGIRYHVGGSRGSHVPGAEQLQITDEGQVVISNKRLVFHGGVNNREWSYAKLVSIQHDASRPITLIHVSNRQKVSGIACPADQAVHFRFALELGVAKESGTVVALLSSIQAERDEHARLRPAPPIRVSGADAPSRAAGLASGLKTLMTGKPGHSAGRRILHTTVAGAAALFVLNAGIGAITGGQSTTVVPQPVLSAPASTEPAPAPTGTASAEPAPTVAADEPIGKFETGPKPKAPKLLPTSGAKVRVGATCRDGSGSSATGQGACSHHGGVRAWMYDDSPQVEANKAKNAERTSAYKAALKKWTAATDKNALLAKYPCSKGPYPEGSPGYRPWRDTNHNGIACG